MSTKIYVWKVPKELHKTLEGIATFVSNGIGEEVKVDDLSCMEECNCDNVLYFGGNVSRYINQAKHKNQWEFPDIEVLTNTDENKITRKVAFDKLKAVIEYISQHKTEDKKVFIEMPSGVTFGRIDANILISEQEATYLKQIRNLLGGGKMVITKGDIRIEVE